MLQCRCGSFSVFSYGVWTVDGRAGAFKKMEQNTAGDPRGWSPVSGAFKKM